MRFSTFFAKLFILITTAIIVLNLVECDTNTQTLGFSRKSTVAEHQGFLRTHLAEMQSKRVATSAKKRRETGENMGQNQSKLNVIENLEFMRKKKLSHH